MLLLSPRHASLSLGHAVHIAGMKNTRGKEEYVNRLLFGIEGARDRVWGGVGCQSDVQVSTCSGIAQNAKSSFVKNSDIIVAC